MHHPHRMRTLALAGVAVASLALVACGDDDDAASETTAAAAPATTAAAAPGTTAHSEHAMVTVDAVDYRFEKLPGTVKAGTMLSLNNTSTAEVHELVALRLPDGESRSVEELLALTEAEQAELFGEAPPATVIIAPPAEVGFPVVGDGSLTEPGRYLVACFIPIGADPAEFLAAAQASGEEEPPQVAGGPPHFTAGMVTEVEVVEA